MKNFGSFREYHAIWRKSPRGRFSFQKAEAKKRNIIWSFTFDDWWKIWLDSGHWEERGTLGYCMCRHKDEGPYSIDNVYIAHHTVNKSDAYYNGKLHPVPKNTCLGKFLPLSDNPKKNKDREYQRKKRERIRNENQQRQTEGTAVSTVGQGCPPWDIPESD